ncbi:BrnT family toxin [Leptospira inadai]|uniref:BrnT family toxin n=1 Tax=Leptospira inadai TaxID=29506 RepID=UPI003B502831
MELQFEYDPRKNSSNIKKHKVDFEDLFLLIWEDSSKALEERSITVGKSIKHRTLLVVHFIKSNYENEEIIRIISGKKSYRERKLFCEL